MSAKAPAKGHTAKHTGTRKHRATGKHHPHHHHKAATSAAAGHHVHTAAHPAKGAKPRGYAVGDLLPVCAFEAVAMSLRLAGQRVGEDDVAGLWELCGAPSVGMPIGQALAAAALFGLAGCRPGVVRRRAVLQERRLAVLAPAQALDLHQRELVRDAELIDERLDDAGRPVRVGLSAVQPPHHQVGVVIAPPLLPAARQLDDSLVGDVAAFHALILGIDAPGPHCVLATADGWWSWGELHSPWPARIEEAWAVSWS